MTDIEEKVYIAQKEEQQLLVREVQGAGEALPGQKVKYRVTRYNKDDEDINPEERDDVRWAIKIDGKKEKLSGKTSERIELEIRQEWAGKEILVMAYLHSPRTDVSVRTKVADTKEYIVISQTGFIRKDFSITPQMERYRINRRLSEKQTVRRLLREISFDNLVVERGIARIVRDYNTRYGNNFPDDYFDTFGRFITVQAINARIAAQPNESRADRIAVALGDVSRLIDSNSPGRFEHGLGAPLFHIYESIVRRNDDTGLDKLLHFLHSAKYAFVSSPRRSFILGVGKEANDERQRLFNRKGEGWSRLDMAANRRGIQFGRELRESLR